MTDGVESRMLRAAMSRAMAMTDREMLELAAKAFWGDDVDDCCSIRWLEDEQAIGYSHADNQDHNGEDQERVWNPLADDGDALRLAVKLHIDFKAYKATVRVWVGDPVAQRVIASLEELCGDDPYAATRRATVRAAASIGDAICRT